MREAGAGLATPVQSGDAARAEGVTGVYVANGVQECGGVVAFRWDIPERFNIGSDVADRHPSARALIEIDPSGTAREFTFHAISALSNRLANESAEIAWKVNS